MKFLHTTSAVAVLALGTTALAHQGATGIVRERMDAMVDIAASVKSVSQMLRGQISYDSGAARAAMKAIEGHASTLPSMFPEGTGAHPSEAAPAIWEDAAGFSAIFAELETAAAIAAAVTDDPDALSAAFARVTKTCTACHEGYRISR